MSTRRTAPLALALLSIGLGAATPAVEGLQTDVAFGGERSALIEEGATRYLYRYVAGPMHVHVRHRAESGLSWAGQLDVMPTFVSSTDTISVVDAAGEYLAPRYERGDLTVHTLLAGRVGYHADWFGAEAGVALPGRPGLPDSPIWLLPTGMVWAGKADAVYAWGRYLYGPTGLSSATAGAVAGLGHDGERFRLLGGYALAGGWLGEAAVTVQPGVRIGAQVARGFGSQADVGEAEIRGPVRITLDHAVIAEQW
jgi:hypothetical protein